MTGGVCDDLVRGDHGVPLRTSPHAMLLMAPFILPPLHVLLSPPFQLTEMGALETSLSVFWF